MPSIYSNEADKTAQTSSRRASDYSTSQEGTQTPQTSSRRSSLKRVLDQLKPLEQPVTPISIYRPIIENGPLFSRRKSAEYKKLSRWQKNASVADLMH